MSPITIRATLGGGSIGAGGVVEANDAPTTQVSNIDTLLEDIYELRY